MKSLRPPKFLWVVEFQYPDSKPFYISFHTKSKALGRIGMDKFLYSQAPDVMPKMRLVKYVRREG